MFKIALLLLLTGSAFAQTPYMVRPNCLPATGTNSSTAGFPRISWNSVGVCVRWDCWATATKPWTEVTYCGTWAEQSKVGGRILTIQKSVDPLKSLQDAGKRFTIVPMTDPSMAGMPK